MHWYPVTYAPGHLFFASGTLLQSRKFISARRFENMRKHIYGRVYYVSSSKIWFNDGTIERLQFFNGIIRLINSIIQLADGMKVIAFFVYKLSSWLATGIFH